MNFEFATATRIIFGEGVIKGLINEVRKLGNKVLFVTGKSDKRLKKLLAYINESEIHWISYHIDGEPTIEMVKAGVELATEQSCNLVVGIGGGSALDAGKAISILLTNPKEIYNYLEVIGKGEPFVNPPVPYIAIPTTAGTGTEVTRNAVLSSPKHHVKVSLRSPMMLPRLAIIDPELTYDLPPNITASTGMDALTQLIEPFVSNQPNPLTDAICREGIDKAAHSLEQVYINGDNHTARVSMSVASLFGGLALANAKLGAVHGFAGPLGGMFPAPHGMICARLLPYVFETNINALKQKEPENPVLIRYQLLSQWITGNALATLQEGSRWLYGLSEKLKVPPLGDYGVSKADIPIILEKARLSSSMKGNPVKLTDQEMANILIHAI
jgi:alcohol dehydrogenase class IV